MCIYCGNPNSSSQNCPCRCDSKEEDEEVYDIREDENMESSNERRD